MELYTIEVRFLCLTAGMFLFVVGMSGNVLIIWTFFRIKRLRIVQNAFVVLLAITDLHIIGLLLPFTMYILITNSAPALPAVCAVFGVLSHMLFTLCLQFIMCIAISRYVKICHLNKFDSLFSRRNVVFLALFCVFYWFVFVIPIFWIDNFIIFDAGLQMCNFNRFLNKTYTNIYIIFCLITPVSVTSTCYLKLYLYIRKTKYKLYKSWNNGLARQRILHELTVTRSQFAVFVAYLVLYMPFGVSTIIGTDTNTDVSWLNALAFYFGLANSCINSILYGLMNNNIRTAYSEVVPCLIKKRQGRIHPRTSLILREINTTNSNV